MNRLLKLLNCRANAGVGFVMVIAAVIVILMLWPVEVSPPPATNCIAGDPPSSEKTLVLPAIKNQYDSPRLGQSPDLTIGGPDETQKVEYQLIRSNVPTAKESTPDGWVYLGSREKSPVEHTINIGEIPEMPGYDLYYPSEWGEMDLESSGLRVYIRRQGILTFIKNDPSQVLEKDGKHIYLAEVYQDKRVLNEENKPYETDELFLCFPNSELTPPTLTIPEQNVSSDEGQLQLQWITKQTNNYWGVHCKPAVYLYPPKKTLVNVKVHPAGFLTYTDPLYDPDTGWNVEAYPDGRIINLSANNFMKQYDYLYFESKVRDEVIEKPTKGWVIKTGNEYDENKFAGQEKLFNYILPKLGLNEIQRNDFIEYWKKGLPYSPYYFIGIIDPANVDEIEGLDISPRPDSVNRVRVYFERLEEEKYVEAPVITDNPFNLDGNQFKVVEWGGMVKNDLNHPFTCSQ